MHSTVSFGFSHARSLLCGGLFLCLACREVYSESVSNLDKYLFCIYFLKWSCIFVLILLIQCVILIDLQILNHLCMLEINPTWAWMIPLTCYGIHFVVLIAENFFPLQLPKVHFQSLCASDLNWNCCRQHILILWLYYLIHSLNSWFWLENVIFFTTISN